MNRLFHPSRRTVLAGLSAGASLLAAPAIARGAKAPVWRANPFSLGVASGAPSADGFVLWTKLAPTPLSDDPSATGGMSGPSQPIVYEVATDDQMRHVVQRGRALAEAELGYSVHKQVRGLKPGRPYWYRFTSGSAESSIGRAMTLPPRNIEKLRFAFFSCSHYEYGYFSAYRHAAEENPDFGIFLGDYIYEYADNNPKRQKVRTHSSGKECVTLAEYRARYTQYRLDPNLQFLHASVPSLVTWDDHEVQNDYADKWGEDFQDPEAFLARRAAAYRTFYEFMPVKPVFSRPHGPDMRLYDRYDFGDLMRVDLIDGRQYRSREACYGDPAKKEGHGGGGHQETPAMCPELMDPARSMIGMAQEQWLFDGLANSPARWNVIANDVLMARLHQNNPAGEDSYWTDGWDGYPPSRTRLMQHIAASKPRRDHRRHSLVLGERPESRFRRCEFADDRKRTGRNINHLVWTAVRPLQFVPAAQSAREVLRKPQARLCQRRSHARAPASTLPDGVRHYRSERGTFHTRQLCRRGRQARSGCSLTWRRVSIAA